LAAQPAAAWSAEAAAGGELLGGAADHRAERKKTHFVEEPLAALDRAGEIGLLFGKDARLEAFVIEDVNASQEDLDGRGRRHLVVLGASGLGEQIDHAEPAGDAEQKRPLLLIVQPVQGFVDAAELPEILKGPAVRGADETCRGRLEAVDPEFIQTGVSLKVRNAINVQRVPEWSNEALFGQDSQFVVVAKFIRGGEEEFIVSDPVTLNQASILPGAVSAETLDFELAPVPVDATNVEYRLVFRGRIGEEADAIAVGLITTPFVSMVSVGGIHSCVTTPNDTYCFGVNWTGELGTTQASDFCFPDINEVPECSFSPITVSGDHRFVSVTAGGSHTCAIDEEQHAFCWGWNGRAQIGAPTDDFCVGPFPSGDLSPPVNSCTREPKLVADGLPFAQVDAGSDHTCGIGTDGMAYCWGLNDVRQIGTLSSDTCVAEGGFPDDLPCLREPFAIGPFETVAAGSSHTCALDANGFAWCWGSDKNGQLGRGGPPPTEGPCGIEPNTFFCSASPVAVAQGRRYRSIDADGDATCAVTLDGDAYCWGRGNAGVLGDGITSSHDRREPTLVVGGHKWAQVDVGSCGVSEDGRTFCWGNGRDGQFGNGTFDIPASGTPVEVDTIVQFRQVSSNGLNACATDGINAHCWGNNLFGENGVPATVDCSGSDEEPDCNPTPVSVPIPQSASTLLTSAPETQTFAARYEPESSLTVVVNSSAILTDLGYARVEASMAGEVSRDDGSSDTYKVPLTFLYPLEDGRCNQVGLVDVVDSSLYEAFLEVGTDIGDPRFPGLAPFARILLGDHFLFRGGRGGYVYAAPQWNKLVIERQAQAGALVDPTIHINEGTDGYQILKDTSRFLRKPNKFLIGEVPSRPCASDDVLAFGYSQTAQLLRSFYFQGLNGIMARERVFDDRLVFEGSLQAAGGSICRQLTDSDPWFSYSTEGCEGATPLAHGRVLTVNTETDVQILSGWKARERPEEQRRYRSYEIAGASHFPARLLDLTALGLRDLATAEQNYVDTAPVFRAMIQNLHDWVREDRDPPQSVHIEGSVPRLSAPPSRFTWWSGKGNVFATKLGMDGNALGGIRLPHVRTVDGSGEGVGGPLGLYRGSRCFGVPTDPDELSLCQDLTKETVYAVTGGMFIPYSEVDPALCTKFYENRTAYSTAVTAAAERAARERWVLPEEIVGLVTEALTRADESPMCVSR
jgi:alpha-tubulin suppressor-like RCC1 family protein